jgi:hypothetical protein
LGVVAMAILEGRIRRDKHCDSSPGGESKIKGAKAVADDIGRTSAGECA